MRRDYNSGMHDDDKTDNLSPELERYLALCQRIYERMRRENSWPWADSPNSGDLVESGDNPPDV